MNVTQQSIITPVPLHFGGATFSSPRDRTRLISQLVGVFTLMRDGVWRSLPEIAARTGYASDASISARLRDLRKPQFGGWVVDRRHEGRGLWRYRVRRVRGTKFSLPVRATTRKGRPQ